MTTRNSNQKSNQKSNRIPFLLLLGLIAVLVSGAAVANAQSSGNHQGKGMKMRGGQEMSMGKADRMDRMAERLELTEEQQASIEKIKEGSREKGLQIHKEILRLKNEMKGEMLKDSPSQKSLLSLNEKLGDLKTEMQANRLKTRLAVREQLTPEQRDKMLVMGENGRKHGRRSGKGFSGSESRHGRFGPRDGSGPRSGVDCQLEEKSSK